VKSETWTSIITELQSFRALDILWSQKPEQVSLQG
jgi:hypothetical protein